MASNQGFAAGLTSRMPLTVRPTPAEKPKARVEVKTAETIPLPTRESLTVDVAAALVNRVSADDESSATGKSSRALASTSALARASSSAPGHIRAPVVPQLLSFHPKPVLPFPKVIVDDIKATPNSKGVVVAGLLAELHRAYVAVGPRLYLWDYSRAGSVYLFERASSRADDPILAVSLMAPRPGVFIGSVRACVAVAYASSVSILAAHFDAPPATVVGAGGAAQGALPGLSTLGDIELVDAGITASAPAGATITAMMPGDAGRVFLGADDGCLYEFVYGEDVDVSIERRGITALAASLLCGRRRCGLRNITRAAGAAPVSAEHGSLLERLPALFFGSDRPSSVTALAYDSSRRTPLVTVLLASGDIQLWWLVGGPSGPVQLAATLTRAEMINQVRARLGAAPALAPGAAGGSAAGADMAKIQDEYAIVAIDPVPAEANPDFHLVATSSAGHRVYLTFSVAPPAPGSLFAGERRSLSVARVRPAAIAPAAPPLETPPGAPLAVAAAAAAAAAAPTAPAAGLAPRGVYSVLTLPSGEVALAMSEFEFPPRNSTGEPLPAPDMVRKGAGPMPATTTLLLMSPELPRDARGVVSVSAAADTAASAPAPGAMVSASSAAATAPLEECAEYVHVGPRVYAMGDLPASYYLSSPGRFLFASSRSVPLAGLHELATQHAVPRRQIVALTGRGVQFFVKDRPVDAVAHTLSRLLAQAQAKARIAAVSALPSPESSAGTMVVAGAAPAAGAGVDPSPAALASSLTGLLANYDPSELGAMLLTIACQPRRAAIAAAAGTGTGLAAPSSARPTGASLDPATDALVHVPPATDAAALERVAALAFCNLNSVSAVAGTPMSTRMTPRTLALVRVASRLLRPVWNWEMVVRLTSQRAAAATADASAPAPAPEMGFFASLFAPPTAPGLDAASIAARGALAPSAAPAESAEPAEGEDVMLRLRYKAAHLESIRAPLAALASFIDLNWSRVASIDIASVAPLMASQLPAGVDVADVMEALLRGETGAAEQAPPSRMAPGASAAAAAAAAAAGIGANDVSAFFPSSSSSFNGSLGLGLNGSTALGGGASAAAQTISHQMALEQQRHALALLIELSRTQAQRELELLSQLRALLRLSVQALTVIIAFARAAMGMGASNPALASSALGRSSRTARAANAASASLSWDAAFDRLPKRLCRVLYSLRFRDLVSLPQGSSALRLLAWRVAELVQGDSVALGLSLAPCLDAGLATAAGAAVDDVDFEDFLARECPSFFSHSDHCLVKARRLATAAAQAQPQRALLDAPSVAAAASAAAAARVPVQQVRRAQLLEAAVALLVEVCASEECDIRVVADAISRHSFYEQAAEVLVARADMITLLSPSPNGMVCREGACRVPADVAAGSLDLQKQWVQRRSHDLQTSVQNLVEQLLEGSSPLRQAQYEAAMRVLLRSQVRLVHDAVYSLLLGDGGDGRPPAYPQALLALRHPALEEFLWRHGQLDVLCDYFMGHSMHEKAVGLFVKLALDVPSDDAVRKFIAEYDEQQQEEDNDGPRAKRARPAFAPALRAPTNDDDLASLGGSSGSGAGRRGSDDVTAEGVYYDDADEDDIPFAPYDDDNDATSARRQSIRRARARIAAMESRQVQHAGVQGPRVRVYTLPERQSFLATALSSAQIVVLRLRNGDATAAAAANSAAAAAGAGAGAAALTAAAAAAAASASAGAGAGLSARDAASVARGGQTLRAEALAGLALQLRERLESAKLQAEVLADVEADCKRMRRDLDAAAAAAAQDRVSLDDGGLVDNVSRLEEELVQLDDARSRLLTQLMPLDPDLYSVASACGQWGRCLEVLFRVREDGLVEHIEQLWGNVMRSEIARAQKTGGDWEEVTAARVSALLKQFSAADAFCPVRFLVTTLERLRYDYGRPDTSLRGFIVDSLVGAGVSADTVALAYADLLEEQAEAPLPEVVLIAWSVVTLLGYIATASKEEDDAAPGSRRAAHLRGLGLTLIKACPLQRFSAATGSQVKLVVDELGRFERLFASA